MYLSAQAHVWLHWSLLVQVRITVFDHTDEAEALHYVHDS